MNDGPFTSPRPPVRSPGLAASRRAGYCRAMWRRCSLGVLLFATVAVLPPLAHASPPDPSWVAGLWDDADYDEIVLAVTGMTAVPNCTPDVVLKPAAGVV